MASNPRCSCSCGDPSLPSGWRAPPAWRSSPRASAADPALPIVGVGLSSLNVLLPLASSVLSLLFAALVLDQWWQRRHSFQLVWGLGLLFYGAATAAEFLGGAFGWSDPIYRAWYLIGAFCVASYLGAGTIYLLRKTTFGYFAAGSIVLGGVFSLGATAEYPGSTVAADITLGVALVAGGAPAATTARRPGAHSGIPLGRSVGR